MCANGAIIVMRNSQYPNSLNESTKVDFVCAAATKVARLSPKFQLNHIGRNRVTRNTNAPPPVSPNERTRMM